VSVRANRVLLGVVGGIAVLAVLAAVFAATRTPTRFGSGTPQRAVQTYVAAVLDKDNVTAAGFFAPGGRCDVEDLDRSWTAESFRIDLVATTIEGDTARVDVQITSSAGVGPFDDGSTENRTFRLTRSGGNWLIAGVPWPLYDCEGGVK
jgi:hypothetical protein